MNKVEYQQYLESDHWKALRRERLELSGYKCDTCGSAYMLQVHHVRYRNIYDCTPFDLQTQCAYCHKKAHGIPTTLRPIKPDTERLLQNKFHSPGAKDVTKQRHLSQLRDHVYQLQGQIQTCDTIIKRFQHNPRYIQQFIRKKARLETKLTRTRNRIGSSQDSQDMTGQI